MKTIVLDTSALIRFYVPDGPVPEGLESQIESAWRSESVLLVPELALAESGQVLLKKEQVGFLSSEEGDEIMSAILELPIEVVGHHNIILDALILARKYRLTVYDSIFLMLALKHNAELITTDQQLKQIFEGRPSL